MPGRSLEHGPVLVSGPHPHQGNGLKPAWRQLTSSKNDTLIGAWARCSFEQGDAVFQYHGVCPCMSSPLRAVLPLVVHYYGCKDNIHELHRINALPTLPQALFGHRRTPPHWTTGDWQLSAGIAITTLPRFALTWAVPCWVSWTYDSEQCLNAHLVTPLQGNLADGLPLDINDLEFATGGPSNEAPPYTSAQDELEGEDSRIDSQDTDDDPMEMDSDDDTREQSGDHLKDCSAPVYYYGTGLFGGLPADPPTDRMDVIIRLSGAYGPSLSQMFCSATKNRTDWHQISRATLKSHAEYLEFCRCLLISKVLISGTVSSATWVSTMMNIGRHMLRVLPFFRHCQHTLLTQHLCGPLSHLCFSSIANHVCRQPWLVL